jgi:ADP-ribosyl-[dinitrogen reductase] hydrolase
MALNRIQQMMLGIAIGDAFGAGYEFLEGGRRAINSEFEFSKYKKHPNPDFQHIAGRYTDDTQMSIAVAETLLYSKQFDSLSLANHFVKAFRRDNTIGYSKRIHKALTESLSGKDFLERVGSDSKGNGAAMRAMPIGLADDLETAVHYAVVNAETTHNTPEGIASSVFISLASHYLIRNPDKAKDLIDFVHPHIQRIHQGSADHLYAVSKIDSLDEDLIFGPERSNKGVPGDATKTIGAVLYIISKYADDPREGLRNAVLLGGDTDSVASMSLGLMAINQGLDTLPSWMMKDLTNHKYGKDYLIKLGSKLAERFDIE